MSRNNEIERVDEDCCKNCGWWWSSCGKSCHCEQSSRFGEHTKGYDVCGHFTSQSEWFNEHK